MAGRLENVGEAARTGQGASVAAWLCSRRMPQPTVPQDLLDHVCLRGSRNATTFIVPPQLGQVSESISYTRLISIIRGPGRQGGYGVEDLSSNSGLSIPQPQAPLAFAFGEGLRWLAWNAQADRARYRLEPSATSVR